MNPQDAKRLEEIKTRFPDGCHLPASEYAFLLRVIEERGKAIEFVRASLLGGLKAVLFVNGKPEGDSEEMVPARPLLRALDAMLGKDPA